NATGALATGATLIVVVVSKFAQGAWLTVVVIPALVWFFGRVNAHYRDISTRIATVEPLDVAKPHEPIVVLASGTWNKMVRSGLQFVMRLSGDVHVVLVKTERDSVEDFSENWHLLIESPLHARAIAAPKLVVLTSAYRQFFKPFVDYVLQLSRDAPERDVVVV